MATAFTALPVSASASRFGLIKEIYLIGATAGIVGEAYKGVENAGKFTSSEPANALVREWNEKAGSEMRVMKDKDARERDVVSACNKLLSLLPDGKGIALEFKGGVVHVVMDGGLDVPFFYLKYADGSWQLAPLDAYAPLLDRESKPSAIVDAYNDAYNAFFGSADQADKLVLRGGNGVDVFMQSLPSEPLFSLSYSSRDNFWELTPKPGLSSLMDRDSNVAEAWNAYKHLAFSANKGFASLLRLEGDMVVYTDGFISFKMFRIQRNAADNGLAWSLDLIPESLILTDIVKLVNSNRFVDAITIAMKASSRDDFMNTVLGEIYLRDGNIDQAESIATKLAGKHSSSRIAAALKASVDLERENYKEVIENSLRIMDEYKNEGDSLANLNLLLACALLHNGEKERALAYYEKGIAIDTEQANIKEYEASHGQLALNYKRLMNGLEAMKIRATRPVS